MNGERIKKIHDEIRRSLPASPNEKKLAEAAKYSSQDTPMPLTEGPYDIFKRHEEEWEKRMVRMREATRQIEQHEKEKISETEERRHQELVEAMKNNSGIQINSGRDTNISGSDLAGRDLKKSIQAPKESERWYKKPIGIVSLAVFAGIIGLLIRALLRYFYPETIP